MLPKTKMSASPDRVFEHLKTAYDKELTLNPSFRGSLDVPQVTPNELKSTTVSDDAVHTIWTEFSSPAGRRYLAVHVPHHPYGPYILFSSPDKEVDDFKAVERDVEKLSKGKGEGGIYDRGGDICDVIKLHALTQDVLADSLIRTAEAFPNFRITHAFYNLVNLKYGDKGINVTPNSLGRRLGVQPTFDPYSRFYSD